MKIAVLMSTYNGHRFLNQQLESLANQTIAENITIYIRDDGSSDDTIEIIEAWKKQIDIIFYRCSNVGPAKSFWELFLNKNIQADYYAFCDQDDIWDADKLEVSIRKLKNDVCLYACNCRIIDENEKILQQKYMSVPLEISIPKLFISGIAQGCAMTFTNALREYILGLDISCVTMHDSTIMLYAVVFGKVYWDEVPHFGYRAHSNNVVAKDNKNFWQKLKTTYKGWKNESQNSKCRVAADLINNVESIEKYDLEFLQNVANYRKSFISKVKLLFTKEVIGMPKRNVNSYRMRIILNLY